MFSIEQRDAQLAGTHAGIRYYLDFSAAAQHLLTVHMEVDAPGERTRLCLPVWTPGSYKVREFSSNWGNIRISDDKGNALAWRWQGKHTVEVQAAGVECLHVNYVYYAFERSVRTSHINRFHAFIMPGTCLPYVDGRMQEIHHVILAHDRTQWPETSTPLSPVHPEESAKGPLVLGALNYDILVDSPLEIGDHRVYRWESNGAQHEVAIAGKGNFNAEWLNEQVQRIVDTEARLFSGLPYDRYVFILQLYPKEFGGLEHARCSVNAMDSNLAGNKKQTLRLLALLCHEMFHLWNVKRIRPAELGPFDYLQENYTRMLWLAEGITSYYDDLLTYRCGFYTRKEYLEALSGEHLWRLERNPGRNQMSIKDSSYLAWVKLYFSNGDSVNRFASYYTTGGAIFFLLDLHIVAETGGTKSMDDAMRALWEHYRARPHTGLNEEEFITIVSEACGLDLGPLLRNWLNTLDDLPYAEYLAKAGLRWAPKPAEPAAPIGDELYEMPRPAKLFTGLGTAERDGRVLVSSVLDGSPAAAAGLGIDDEIIAVNGLRIATNEQFENAVSRNGTATAVEILACCDRRTFTCSFVPQERPEYAILIDEEAPEHARNLLETYLKR